MKYAKRLNRIATATEMTMPGEVMYVTAAKANAATLTPIARDGGEPGKVIPMPAGVYTTPIDSSRAQAWKLQTSGDTEVFYAVAKAGEAATFTEAPDLF